MKSMRHDLSHLLAPFTPAEFLDEYWEKRPLIASSRPEGYLAGLFSRADVDRLITYNHSSVKNLFLVKEDTLFPQHYLDYSGTALLSQIRRGWRQGYTLVINNLHQKDERIANLTLALEGEIGHRIVVSMYLTPKHSQGFELHFDYQDAFLLQIEGSKRWRVYQPVIELPIREQHRRVRLDELGPAILDCELQAGDVLYIPAGFPHEGAATEEPSLHLTVAVNRTTWADLLKDSIYALQLEHAVLRRAVPTDLLNGNIREAARAEFDRLLGLVAELASMESAVARGVREFARDRIVVCNGLFSLSAEGDEITAETVVVNWVKTAKFLR